MLNRLFESLDYIATSKAIDASALRQKTIAHNLANVDTPHYKRSEVNFEDAFKRALEKTPKRLAGFKTDGQHIPINPPSDPNGVKPTIWRQNDTFSRADDNNVDLDVEMAELAKAQLMYDALMESMDRNFKNIQLAMRRSG